MFYLSLFGVRSGIDVTTELIASERVLLSGDMRVCGSAIREGFFSCLCLDVYSHYSLDVIDFLSELFNGQLHVVA